MIAARLIRIVVEFFAFGLWWVLRRLRLSSAGPPPPQRLRRTLERLGATFVKFGQALSLRRDVLPDDYVIALQDLQDRMTPFSGAAAVEEIERELGRPIDELFTEFDREPFAAASIAQVHRARLADGRAVIVKVRRIGIKSQIDRDMRTLQWVTRVGLALAPGLRRLQPLRLVEEVWSNLRKETDFRQEARNIRRFAEAFAGSPTIHIPALVDDLYSESILVQELSGGKRIDDPEIRPDGPRLAQALVDAYLHQLFVLGVFHGDPHPGNIFITPAGKICLHDFGLVGFLDRATRRRLAGFTLAFIEQDAGWLLDCAIDLGVLSGEMERGEVRHSLEEILADYTALPLKEWSLAEAFLRVTRLGSGHNVAIPHNLLVLMRTMFLIEYAVRTLDPEFMLLDSLIAKGGEMLKAAVMQPSGGAAMARLRHETVVAAQDLPAVLGAWLHRMQSEGGGPELGLRHRGLDRLEEHLDRGTNRLALALVTLGLYVAASLLMQHSIGPRLFGDMPVLAALGYALALWFTLRLARGISRSGQL